MSRMRINRKWVETFSRLPLAKQIRRLERLTITELREFDALFDAWADPAQMPPPGDGWSTWLMMAGRGYGKTRAGAEWVHRLAMQRPVRIALVGASMDEARLVMVEGESGVLAVAAREGVRLSFEASLGRVRWPNGSVATVYSGDSGEGLRGPEHHYAWCDELAKWRDGETAWNNLRFGLRMGVRPRALVTTTPRGGPLLRRILAEATTVTTHGKSEDNVSLSKQFLDVIKATYAGTLIGRQELDGELIEDAQGSLWPRKLIERCQVAPALMPMMERIVVGVDPPAGSHDGCDACGIVVAGKSGDHYYVLADMSVETASPEQWGRAVVGAVEAWGADRIVAEANNGGEMVRGVIEGCGASRGMVRLVHASRGKSARAEPVALRFEAGRAWFGGRFLVLEDQLAGLCAGGGYDGPGRSPDRADALVWAMVELAGPRSGVPRVLRL